MSDQVDVLTLFWAVFAEPFSHGTWVFLAKMIPFVLFLEIPVYVATMLGIIRYVLMRYSEPLELPRYLPKVSCIVTCYNESEAVALTLRSLSEQLYAGHIEILAMVDGANKNRETLEAAEALQHEVDSQPGRRLLVIPKWLRGGRVSSLNAGLAHATGEIVMALDGDTSFDNDMVAKAMRNFADPKVIAVSGMLRPRNVFANWVTKMQGIEYLLSILGAKTGLSSYNIVNNVSGAFGIFRRKYVELVGGWNTGTAEDLDMTLRLKNHFGRDPDLRIIFDPECIGHTDVPDTLGSFFRQRLRWDGDLFYLYFRKHPLSLQIKLIGLSNFLALLMNGLFFQIVTPFLILGYSAVLLYTLSLSSFLLLNFCIYILYLAIELMFFFSVVILLSEKPSHDLKLLPWTLLVPLFTFSIRLWSAVATLWEITHKNHLDSGMAPYWVLKRPKL